MRSRRAIPPRLLEPPPEVNIGLEIYMRAFWDLVSDRTMQGGRIPWTAVHLWCRAHDVDRDDEGDAHFLVGRLDIEYLKWMQKKSVKTK